MLGGDLVPLRQGGISLRNECLTPTLRCGETLLALTNEGVQLEEGGWLADLGKPKKKG